VAGKDENVKLPPKEKREICSKKSGLKWCSWNLKGPYTNGKSTPPPQTHWQKWCAGTTMPAHVTGVHKRCLQITMFGRSQRQASQWHVQRMYNGNFKKGWCGVYRYTVHPAALGNMMPSGRPAKGCMPTLPGVSSSVSSQMRYFSIDALQCSFIIR
jgi:hypothetical protein